MRSVPSLTSPDASLPLHPSASCHLLEEPSYSAITLPTLALNPTLSRSLSPWEQCWPGLSPAVPDLSATARPTQLSAAVRWRPRGLPASLRHPPPPIVSLQAAPNCLPSLTTPRSRAVRIVPIAPP